MNPASSSASSRTRGLFRVGLACLLPCVIWFYPWPSPAQALAPALAQVRRSHSGQFIVNIVPPKAERSRLVSNLDTNLEYIRLDPTLLPVSCERIKQVLSRQLGWGSPWTGKIFLSLFPAGSGDDSVTITSGRFRDGWQYQVQLPDVVSRVRYVRAIVQVLLLETANRTATEHPAEIPAWLNEGLSQHILLSSEMEVILPPPRPAENGFSLATQVVNARKENPMVAVHKQLAASPPMTFQQLSWPAPDQLEGEAAATYRNSAYLFVHELLQLDDGRACLQIMLAQLPRHYNWQFAFLQAFRGHFQRPLDVEKWWTLHLEHFTGRELAQTWPAAESWQKLDELVRSAVEVRVGTNEMPMHAEIKLQTIVRDWDRPHQDQTLPAKMRELQMLRLRLAKEFAPLADEYHRVLSDFLATRNRGGFPFRKKAARQQVVDNTVRRLDELDSRRQECKPIFDAALNQADSRPR